MLFVTQVFYLLFISETDTVNIDEQLVVVFLVAICFFLKTIIQRICSNMCTGTMIVLQKVITMCLLCPTSPCLHQVQPASMKPEKVHFYALAFHKPTFTLTLCSPFSKRDNISDSLLSECTLYTVQQRCCSSPMMYSFSICSCILNSLKVAHSDWRKERKSLLLEKLVFDSCTGETMGTDGYDVTRIHDGVVAKTKTKTKATAIL